MHVECVKSPNRLGELFICLLGLKGASTAKVICAQVRRVGTGGQESWHIHKNGRFAAIRRDAESSLKLERQRFCAPKTNLPRNLIFSSDLGHFILKNCHNHTLNK